MFFRPVKYILELNLTVISSGRLENLSRVRLLEILFFTRTFKFISSVCKWEYIESHLDPQLQAPTCLVTARYDNRLFIGPCSVTKLIRLCFLQGE
jgi:hypothetical protein